VVGGAVAFAPDGSKFAFGDINRQIFYADVNNYAPTTLVSTGFSAFGMTWGR
jgi:hypothetical protein